MHKSQVTTFWELAHFGSSKMEVVIPNQCTGTMEQSATGDEEYTQDWHFQEQS